MTNFEYTVTTNKSFNQVVDTLQAEAKNAGFRVLYIHDVTGTLQEKGFDIEPLKIIEICNAKSAYQVLKADIRMSLCLPCKINVYQKNGLTYISGMRPVVLTEFFPDTNLGNLPNEIDSIIRDIIDKSK